MNTLDDFSTAMATNGASFAHLDSAVIKALWLWLANAQAQDLSLFASSSAANHSEAVERTQALSEHPCIALIHESLSKVIAILKTPGQSEDFKMQMREINSQLAQCAAQEQALQQQIDLNVRLRQIVQQTQTDLNLHQAALSLRLPEWQAEVIQQNPLNDLVLRNDTANRRLQSIVALIQSSQSAELQLSLMYNQKSRLLENLTTIRQVTYPIWQQKAINQTMIYDQAFLDALQKTLNATREDKL